MNIKRRFNDSDLERIKVAVKEAENQNLWRNRPGNC